MAGIATPTIPDPNNTPGMQAAAPGAVNAPTVTGYNLSANTNPSSAQFGENSPGVLSLQQSLNKTNAGQAGYTPLKEDGLYGPLTKAATTFKPTSSSGSAVDPNATIASVYQIPGQSTNPDISAAETAAENFSGNQANGTPNFDENAVRQATLGQFQGEIDATNGIYASKLQDAKNASSTRLTSDLGTNAAQQARRGLLGSDFGSGQTGAIKNSSDTALKTTEGDLADKQNAALQAIYDKANAASDKAISDKNTAMSAGLDSHLKYLEDADTRNATNATNAANAIYNQTNPATGKPFDIKDLTPDQIAKTAAGFGVTPEALKAAYGPVQKAGDAAAAAAAQKSDFKLAPGETQYDANGKPIASAAPKDTYKDVVTTDDLGNQSVRILDTNTGKYVNSSTAGGSPKTSGTPTSTAGGAGSTPVSQTPGGAQATTPNSKLDFNQYGLLAHTDFNPSNTVDQLSQKYLDSYIKNGTVPTASTLGRGIKPGAMAQIDSRARDLYFKATGTALPSPEIIKGQQAIINNNNKLANNLKIQEQTVKNNIDFSLQNLKSNNLNSIGFKPLDNLINTISDLTDDPGVGQMLAQNSTIQNELGSLLAVKNASGTTVYDKLTSAGIISSADNAAQITAKVGALLKEASNFADSIGSANAAAYKQTDPFLQDPNNPLRAIYSAAPADTTPLLGPDGTQYYIPNANVDAFLKAGGSRI